MGGCGAPWRGFVVLEKEEGAYVKRRGARLFIHCF